MENELNILIADDEAIVHKTIGDYLRDVGHKINSTYDGQSALKMIQENEYDLALVDIKMPKMDGLALLDKIQTICPEMSVVLITAHGTVESVVRALRQGAVDFLTKPVKFLDLDAVLEKSIRIRELRQGQRHLRETIRGLQASENLRHANRKLIGMSRNIQKVREHIKQVVDAKLDTILIEGETGTGKEVVAREIHFQTCSDEDAFIAVNCPALPDSLVESELFGHTKGAFTGATSERAGYFELADGGTLFLDEIGDLSPSAQAKMLRVLETRTLRRIGGSKEKKVNVRVIGATNTSLEKLVDEGKFRRDLLYRLNLYPIHIDPLRERKPDIRPLAEHFLNLYAKRSGRKLLNFSPDVMELLLEYDYPGNVRELQHIVERAAILSRGNQIKTDHIIIQSSTSPTVRSSSSAAKSDQEREAILDALEKTHWNRREAAKMLGMPYSTLRYKIDTLGIKE